MNQSLNDIHTSFLLLVSLFGEKERETYQSDWVLDIVPSENKDECIREQTDEEGKQQGKAKKSENAKAKMLKKMIKNEAREDKSSKSM